MRKILIILLLRVSVYQFVSGQSLLQQIEQVYNRLDSVMYVESVVNSYRTYLEEFEMRMDNVRLERCGFDYKNMLPIDRQKILDSLNEESRKLINYFEFPSIDEEVEVVRSIINSYTTCFALNLILTNEQTLQVDTNKLAFNLISFDKRDKPQHYVFVDSGRYIAHGQGFPSFRRIASINANKIIRKIVRKNPKYILYCDLLLSYLYVLNDQIFIYRIFQMKEYKLDEYLKLRSAGKFY